MIHFVFQTCFKKFCIMCLLSVFLIFVRVIRLSFVILMLSTVLIKFLCRLLNKIYICVLGTQYCIVFGVCLYLFTNKFVSALCLFIYAYKYTHNIHTQIYTNLQDCAISSRNVFRTLITFVHLLSTLLVEFLLRML